MDADFGLPGDNLLGLLDDTFQPHPFPPEALSPSQATGRSYTAPMPMHFDGSNPVASTGTQVRPLPFPFPSPRRRRGLTDPPVSSRLQEKIAELRRTYGRIASQRAPQPLLAAGQKRSDSGVPLSPAHPGSPRGDSVPAFAAGGGGGVYKRSRSMPNVEAARLAASAAAAPRYLGEYMRPPGGAED